MSWRSRLLSWVNVRRGEEYSATLLLFHSFFMGISTVYFETAASALFLARFEADLLPYVYMAAAVLNTLTGFIYARVKQRLPFARLMFSTLLFLFTFVCIFRVGLSLSDAAWLVFSLLIWYRVLSILTDLEYWAVATRMYDVRQSKRLFSLVGSGEVVARIAGSFSVPFLVGHIGVPNLMVVAAVGLLGCLFILLLIFRDFPKVAITDEAWEKSEQETEARKGWGEFFVLLKDHYLRLIFLLAVLAVLGKYFVDFAFLAQMQTRYHDVENLAGFFGIFSGVTQAVNLIMRVFVSGRLISRFGIQTGLLVLPLVQAFCTVLIIAAGGFGAEYLIFWLVMSNQGIYKTLKHPIDNPSFKVLYQPLRAHYRLSAQIAVEVIVTPVTIGVAGAIMLLFSTVISFDPVRFAYVMLVTFVIWAFLAVAAFRQYSFSLLRALEKRTLDGSSLVIEDEQSIALIRSRLLSENPADVIFSIDLLKKIEHPTLESHLIALLAHPSPEVRRYVLLEIERLKLSIANESVNELLEHEESPTVCAAALRALAAMGGRKSLDLVAGYLEHEASGCRLGALIGLLRSEDPGAVRSATRHLEHLVESPSDDERILATQVLGEVQLKDPRLLMVLLADEAPAVRQSALQAAGRAGDPTYVPVLIEHLNHPRYRPAAATSLAGLGENALAGLAEAFSNKDLSHRALAQIARICRRIRSPRAVQVLWKAFDYPDPVVRKEVLSSMADGGCCADRSEHPRIETRIQEEIADAARKLGVHHDIARDPDLAIVKTALIEELKMNRERVLFLLSFLFDAKSIRSTMENIGHESREKRAYALEILDVTLPMELKKVVIPLVEESSSRERYYRLRSHFPQPRRTPAKRVGEILTWPDEWMTLWSKACAVYCTVKLPDMELSDTLCKILTSSTSPLLAETARWAIARRGGKRAQNNEGTGRLLTIEKVILLKGIEMFSRTSEEILAEVATILEDVELAPGEVIFERGDVGDSMYIIVSGRVRVYDGDKTINYLDEKEIFGELALLDPEPRSASIEAVEETRLFRLDRDTFFELMADNIGVVSGIMRVLCQRLRRMTKIVTENQ